MNEVYFSPDWAEFNLPAPLAKPEAEQKKDLGTLLKELEEIKDNLQEVCAKQWRLANLMKFYKGNLG